MPPKHRYRFLLFSVGLVVVLAFLLANVLFTQASPNGDYALHFDGTTDNVRLIETINLMGTPTWVTTKTVSMWVRPLGTYSCASPPVPSTPVTCDAILGDSARWWGISRGINVFPPAGGDMIWVWSWDGNLDAIGIPYTVGEWTHIALVHGGGRLRAYKNGVLIGDRASGPTQQPITGAQPILHFGGLVESSTPYMFEGQIDEVQIWNVARSADEIRQGMYRTLTGSEPGLRAYYQMSDGSGLTVTDNSANNFNGTLRDGWIGCNPPNCPPPNGTYPLWIASGALTGPRNTLDFDGVNDYVDIGSNAVTVIGGGWAGTKSADVWVKPTAVAPIVTSASQGEQVFGGANWGVSQANIDGQDRLWVWNNDGNEDRMALEYVVGQWTHITLVHQGGLLTAYQGGVEIGSVASGSTTADGTLTIGGLSSGQNFQGQLDELRLWNDGRSPAEVQTNLYQTVEHNDSGLMAYYRFDQQNQTGQTEVVDSTSNGRHATMINMDPATDWMASTAFNTWVGDDDQIWLNSSNWSRSAPNGDNLGITNYPGGIAPVITTTTTFTDAAILPGASLTVNDDLTVNGALFNLGTLTAVNLSVSPGARLEMSSGAALTITGTLENDGTLKQTQAVSGSVAGFFDIGGYGGLIMDPGAQNLGDTAVTIRANQECTSVAGESVLRCFDITPEIAPSSGVSMTFAFADSEIPGSLSCETVNLFHYGAGIWTEITPTLRSCSQPLNTITVENVVNFSPFVIGQIPNTPTAVNLTSFSAIPSDVGQIIVPLLILLMVISGLLGWRFWRESVVGR